MSLEGNRTIQILRKAEREGYGVLAQAWYDFPLICLHVEINTLFVSYDANMAIGLVRAAERSRSPAILQMFPITLEYGKGPFLQFCLNL